MTHTQRITNRITLQQARKMLPPFAVGLGIYARTVTALRDSVLQELEMFKDGHNPLEPNQVAQLKRFLEKTK